MRVLRIIAVFAVVTVTVTVAGLTALFAFWNTTAGQPGTGTALALLFLGAPGLGIASGLFMSIRAARLGPASPPDWVIAVLAVPVGLFAGFGGTMAGLDLFYVERWTNPSVAPPWLPWAPYVGAPAAALALVLLALAGRPREAR